MARWIAATYSTLYFIIEWSQRALPDRRGVKTFADQIANDLKELTEPVETLKDQVLSGWSDLKGLDKRAESAIENISAKIDGIDKNAAAHLNQELAVHIEKFAQHQRDLTDQIGSLSRVNVNNENNDSMNELSIQKKAANASLSAMLEVQSSLNLHVKNELDEYHENIRQLNIEIDAMTKTIKSSQSLVNHYEKLNLSPTWVQKRLKAPAVINWLKVYGVGLAAPVFCYLVANLIFWCGDWMLSL